MLGQARQPPGPWEQAGFHLQGNMQKMCVGRGVRKRTELSASVSTRVREGERM